MGTRARLGSLDHLSVVDEEVLELIGSCLDDRWWLLMHGGCGQRTSEVPEGASPSPFLVGFHLASTRKPRVTSARHSAT
ncbi:hypothetical protein G7043_08390 [Lentzea sp. NEAU-D13]|uniref:Uncharacterized protein n=1 Tax=Lentzea alba TaxID=2714351 RepID=A0A7C9RP76_9PSEU|nr:hypothetical protein [Lentzea alba]NGY58943.1 hypothetical protein [Lentzea alba]